MIQANELRIGNWVKIPDEIICFVTLVGEYRCYLKADKKILPKFIINGSVAIEDISPIPLTTEILEKCGFEKDNSYAHETYVEKYHVSLNDHFSMCQVGSAWNCMTIAPNLNIKSLHQLQNLYFALTGEELNYKK